MNEALNAIAIQAAQSRDRSDWAMATSLYQQLVRALPSIAEHWHNLALSYLGSGYAEKAIICSERALQLNADLWQSHVIMGKAQRILGHVEQAEAAFTVVVQRQSHNPEARLGLADLSLNEFGDPLAAIEWVRPLFEQPDYAEDAQLTTLMASLYDRDFDAAELVRRIRTYAQQSLQLPLSQHASAQQRIETCKRKKRVGLLSSQFCASPVYFLTFAFFKELTRSSEIIVFSRGVRADWATQQFRDIAHAWHDLAHVDALSLSTAIAAEQIDDLYDLGGWMDPVGLKALSTRPAARQYKWVGGQSVTTGLDCFDGWIGDRWHCPNEMQHLYSEPLINTADDYVMYTPPAYLPKPAQRKSADLAIFANPAKLSRAFMVALRQMPGHKCFIHRQYRHARVQEKIREQLGSRNTSFITPENHQQTLAVLNRHQTLIDTFPYSSGLTAREAVAMETQVRVLHVGELFCERHTARYAL